MKRREVHITLGLPEDVSTCEGALNLKHSTSRIR